MKNSNLWIMTILLLVVVLSCKKETETVIDEEENVTEQDQIDPNFETNSKNVSYDNAVYITYSTSGVEVSNSIETGVTVTTADNHVTVRSTLTDTEVNYVVAGSTENGSLKIYSEATFGLILNGTSIINPSGAAINIQSGKAASVTLESGTNSRLIDGQTYTSTLDEDEKGTFFSEGELIFGGEGTLQVRSYTGHAIASDDHIVVNKGDITVTTAVKDAIHANDYIHIAGGTLNLTSKNDGIDSEGYVEITGGSLTITISGDKADAIKSAGNTVVNTSGTVSIQISGNAGKGFKTTGDFILLSGEVTINSIANAFYDTEDRDISSSAGVRTTGNVQIDGGKLTITASGSGGKGINADGTLVVNDGEITVTTTGGQFVYSGDDTAAKAIKSDGNLTVNGGTITISTSGVEAEGLESKARLTINNGHIVINAYDDAINAATHIAINGGTIYCYSATNDAVDSNGTLSISGGTVVAVGAGSPEAGFDCDNSTFAITGGTVLGIGGSTSTPTASASNKYSVVYGGTGTQGQIINIRPASGTSVLTFRVPRTYSNRMTLLFSSPDLSANTSYTIYNGGTLSGGTDFHGLYTGATYSGGSSVGSFTTSSIVSTVGSTGGR